MGNRKFSELRAAIAADPIRAERLQRASEEVSRAYDAYQANLRQLRQARGLTQVQLAKILGISQPEVSRIERQTDVYLSTLQSYVAAMGGELKLMAVFGDDEPSMVDVSDVAPASTDDDFPILSVSPVRPEVAKPTETTDLPQALTMAALKKKASAQTLKEVANFLHGHRMLNAAYLFAASVADRLAADGDRIAAARELGTAGATAHQNRNVRIAEIFWRRSLDYDPTNYRSRSRLGQVLHHQGRYSEAIENLETVESMDNYAALFLGWSQLMKGLDNNDDKVKRQGVDTLITAMHRWAYESRSADRPGWLRQVKRLDELGVEFRQNVDNLLAFASSNSNFGQVTRDDLTELDAVASNSVQQSNFDDRDEPDRYDFSEGGALDRETAPGSAR